MRQGGRSEAGPKSTYIHRKQWQADEDQSQQVEIEDRFPAPAPALPFPPYSQPVFPTRYADKPQTQQISSGQNVLHDDPQRQRYQCGQCLAERHAGKGPVAIHSHSQNGQEKCYTFESGVELNHSGESG